MKYYILMLAVLMSCCTQTMTEPNNAHVPQLTEGQYRNQLTQHLYTQATYISNIREKQYKTGHYGSTEQEQEADKSYSVRIQQYTGNIRSLDSLENLTRYFWELDCPDYMPLDPWSQAKETIIWYLCESIAKKGTEEAYQTLLSLKKSYSDGAMCGHFRSLEWQYLRQYSQDPVVKKSRHGIFH